MERINKLKKASNLCFGMLLFLMSLVLFTSLAKYSSVVAGSSVARIAAPVVSLSTNDSILLATNSVNPKTTQEIEFEVSNKEDEKISEVSLNYFIQIESFENLPMIFELYKYEDGNYTEMDFEDNKSEQIKIDHSTLETHKYKLVIKWDSTKKDYKYSKEIDYIKVKINAIQID